MSIEEYLRRAARELTGQKLGKLDTKVKNLNWLPLVLAGAIVTLILVGGIIWALLPNGNQKAVDCVFRIPEAGSTQPATPGDATVELNTCVKLEKTESPSARTLGLSNRTSMPRDHGMLFDFGQPDRYCMWMKDMRFSLDMLWVNEAKKIVLIRHDITPDTYPTSFCGPSEARYVIELNAGTAKAGDLRLGQTLSF